MPKINLHSTLDALQLYEKKHDDPKDRYVLKLVQEGDSMALAAVPRAQLGIVDKFKSFFGFGDYKLSKITALLRSNDFCEALDKEQLDHNSFETIQHACNHLDEGIVKHNSRPWFLRSSITGSICNTVAPFLHEKVAQVAKPLITPTPAFAACHVVSLSMVEGLNPKYTFKKMHAKLDELGKLPPADFQSQCSKLAEETLKRFESKLKSEFTHDNVSVDEQGKLQFKNTPEWYPRFLDLYKAIDTKLSSVQATAFKETHQGIINQLYVEQELKACDLSVAVTVVTSKLAPDLSPKQIKSALTNALKTVSSSNEAKKLTFDAVKERVADVKFSAALKAGNIESHSVLKKRKELETMYNELENVATEEQEAFRSNAGGIPNLADKQLFGQFAHATETALIGALETYAEKQEPTSKDTFTATCKAEAAKYQPQIDFYKRWSKALKQEMIQGFHDQNEILGEGICWALSLRWALAEMQKTPEHDFVDVCNQMQIGKTTPKDRFRQVLMTHARQLENSPDVAKYKQGLGISKTDVLPVAENVAGKDRIREKLQEFLGDNFIIGHKGVGQLIFRWGNSGHAITICCQSDARFPEKSVFRISDPNIGTLHLTVGTQDVSHWKTQTRFLDCLTELLTTFYSSTFTEISCHTFELKK